MKIHRLPDLVINQIAAGEVVERPVAVVKELVDNALDAKATSVVVTIEEGGQALIRVSDNGVGMERGDAALAFERHATSKLASTEDLERIATMGFRGEALASIASVARVRLTTREQEASLATILEVEGGKLGELSEAVAPRGTTVEVRNLFFNTPARKKFLKSPRTEGEKIKFWLQHVALGHPQVAFSLLSDGKQILAFPAVRSVAQRAQAVFSTPLHEVRSAGEVVSVIGGVAHPSVAANSSEGLVLLVNGRVVQDRMLLRAVRDGFDSMLKYQEFPIGFICVAIDPAHVDVNVHPQKTEVRFRAGQAVFGAVRAAVASAVAGTAPRIVAEEPPPAWNFQSSVSASPVAAYGNAALRFQPAAYQQGMAFRAPSEHPAPVGETIAISEHNACFSDIKLYGQALECFLVGERAGELILIDMHAAHERVNFNRIRQGFERSGFAVQQLLVPVTVSLSAAQHEALMGGSELLQRIGFEYESFGEQAVIVRASPALFAHQELERVITEAADALLEAPDGKIMQMRLDAIAARIACHASIRSGDALTLTEAYHLLSLLDEAEFATACPHGRPVLVAFTRPQIERWFGRDD